MSVETVEIGLLKARVQVLEQAVTAIAPQGLEKRVEELEKKFAALIEAAAELLAEATK